MPNNLTCSECDGPYSEAGKLCGKCHSETPPEEVPAPLENLMRLYCDAPGCKCIHEFTLEAVERIVYAAINTINDAEEFPLDKPRTDGPRCLFDLTSWSMDPGVCQEYVEDCLIAVHGCVAGCGEDEHGPCAGVPTCPDYKAPGEVKPATDFDLLDSDGYPTDEALEHIKAWTVNTFQDAADAMDYAGQLWYYPNAWKVDEAFIDPDCPNDAPKRQYVFSTGGWSGNESVVAAIKANETLQMLGAWLWRRGGHYEYRFSIPEARP